MRLKKAQKYVEKALPVLVDHIREKYLPDFVAPEVVFDNSWIPRTFTGFYDFRRKCYEYDGKIIITREGRVCLRELASTLTHESGHALLDQVNPDFRYIYFHSKGHASLCEGLARVLEEEGEKKLRKKRLFSYSFLGDIRIGLNQLFNPMCWLAFLKREGRPYTKGDKTVKNLRKNQSLVEIMEQAHEPKFFHSKEK